MLGKIQVRLALLAALAALTAVLVPAGMAGGSQEASPAAAGDASIVHLTFGNGPNDRVTWGDATQDITTKNNDCLSVSFDDPDGADLLNVDAIGGQLGEVKNGLGVKSANDGAGEPCGRVEADDGEALSVMLGSDLADYTMTAIDLDLELKFGATVVVEYLHDGQLVDSDTFDPSDASDDGPDSNDGDNYRYFYRPDGSFDEVILKPIVGAMSLEGGADGTENSSNLDTTRNSSQFEVIKTFDGEITCGDEVTISEAGVDVSGVVTMHSMEFDPEGEQTLDWYTTGCLLKLYNDDVTDTELFFLPELEDTSARYTLEVTALNQAVTTSNGQVTSLIMDYSPSGDFNVDSKGLQACEGQPNLDESSAGYTAFWEQADVGLLPAGETACYYSATVTPTAPGQGTEVWGIYFEDDPGFSAR